jgi:phosphatidylethanolamine/phosphatidyl-N-methylethanolamine N-methyltransferase
MIQLADRLKERVLFFKKYLNFYTRIGAVTPASQMLATKLSSVVEKIIGDEEVIELGAGTGSLTAEIRHLAPVLVEIDEDFCTILRLKYPELKILNECAVEYLNKIDSRVGLIISIPLVGNGLSLRLKESLWQLYETNKLSWCAIYTYSPFSPLAALAFKESKRVAFVPCNIPPATIWVYK